MRDKIQTIYDFKSDQYIHLKKEYSNISPRVDINELNKRLNSTKRTNFYITSLFIVFSFSCLFVLAFIAIKF